MINLFVLAMALSSGGDLLIKNNGTSCHFDKQMNMECVTIRTFKTDAGQIYTAIKRCNSSKEKCVNYAIDRDPRK